VAGGKSSGQFLCPERALSAIEGASIKTRRDASLKGHQRRANSVPGNDPRFLRACARSAQVLRTGPGGLITDIDGTLSPRGAFAWRGAGPSRLPRGAELARAQAGSGGYRVRPAPESARAIAGVEVGVLGAETLDGFATEVDVALQGPEEVETSLARSVDELPEEEAS
jgi:hypothetical protein